MLQLADLVLALEIEVPVDAPSEPVEGTLQVGR